MPKVVGLDGYEARWVGVVLKGGAFGSAHIFETVQEAVSRVRDATVFAVDIPIGLPTSGARAADSEARAFVGERRSSVFPTVPRRVLAQPTYQEALATARISGKGLSAQSYALRSKIFEVEAIAEADTRVYEVHPEVSFRAMAGKPLPFYKKTAGGVLLRLELLRLAGIVLPPDLGEAGLAPPDDVLDAAAAAWSAHRIASGGARSLPDPPERDATGRAVAIWY